GALTLVVLLPLLVLVAREKRADEHDRSDLHVPSAQPRQSADSTAPWSTRKILCDTNFVAISIPFALGLVAQVGFLTHQVAFLAPMTGTITAAWIVSLTTFAAIVGRLGTSLFVDRVDRRAVSCGNFLLQVLAMTLLISTASVPLLVVGCALFGLTVGNL